MKEYAVILRKSIVVNIREHSRQTDQKSREATGHAEAST